MFRIPSRPDSGSTTLPFTITMSYSAAAARTIDRALGAATSKNRKHDKHKQTPPRTTAARSEVINSLPSPAAGRQRPVLDNDDGFGPARNAVEDRRLPRLTKSLCKTFREFGFDFFLSLNSASLRVLDPAAHFLEYVQVDLDISKRTVVGEALD